MHVKFKRAERRRSEWNLSEAENRGGRELLESGANSRSLKNQQHPRVWMRLSGSVSSEIWSCAESKPLLVIILKPPFQPGVAQLVAECGPLLAGVKNGTDRMEFSEECAVNRLPSVSLILLSSCVQRSDLWVCPTQINPTGSRKLDTSPGFTDTFSSSARSTKNKRSPPPDRYEQKTNKS